MSKAISNLNKQLASLNPDVVIDLYEIDFSNIQHSFEMLKDLEGINIGSEPIYRFCGMINGTNPIYWQGYAYQPLPIKAEEFEARADGRLPRPKLTIANPEGLLSNIVHSNDDFANCKVTRKRTYARFLDDDNFQNRNLNEKGKNPFGESDPDSHLPDDVYFINKKTEETKDHIQFELVSALELEESRVPARVVLSNYCNWTYRCSVGCGYKGLAIETIDGKDLTKGFAKNAEITDTPGVYDLGYVDPNEYSRGLLDIPEWNRSGRSIEGEDNFDGYNLGESVKITPRNSNNPYKSTPHVFVCVQTHSLASQHHPFFDKEYWLKDECQKSIEACKKRFDPGDGHDYEQYVNAHTDLIDAYNIEVAAGDTRTKEDWGRDHWLANGQNEPDRIIKSINPFLKHSKIERTHRGIRFGGFPGTERYPVE